MQKNVLVHTSTNLKQSSIRLHIPIAGLFNFNFWSQYVSQAYLQSAESLMPYIYLRNFREFKLSKEYLLKLLKPLHGLTDSRNYRHTTSTRHLRKEIEMVPIFLDPASFFIKQKERCKELSDAMLMTQVQPDVNKLRKKENVSKNDLSANKENFLSFSFLEWRLRHVQMVLFKLIKNHLPRRFNNFQCIAVFRLSVETLGHCLAGVHFP